MQSRSIIRCAIILGLVGAQAAGAPRIGELDVRPGDAGLPCFTISEAEERRSGTPDFQSISVVDSAANVPVWSMAMPPARTFPLAFLMCVPYAGRLSVLPQTPAVPLQPGRTYEVMIAVRAPRQAGAPRSYHARFCLVAQGSGEPQVRKLDPKLRRACGA